MESSGVGGGELEAVEQGGGRLGVEVSSREGVDDLGEGDLDGFAVFERDELDVLAGQEIACGARGVTILAVGFVEAMGERSRSARA